MKNEKNKHNKNFFVLIDRFKNNAYKGNQVIACSSEKDLIEKYRCQLLDNNYDDNFKIEEREHIGWSSFIRYQDYELVEYQGGFFPSKNIKLAKSQLIKLVQNLKTTKSNLEELKNELSDADKISVNNTIEILERKIALESNKELKISMI